MLNVEMLKQLDTTEEKLCELLDRDVRDIFTTMVGIDVSAPKQVGTETKFKEYVSALVGFAGSYGGVLSINAPKKLTLHFASQMLGMELTELDDDSIDALGEIANMIGGSFKHHFICNGTEVQISIPSVISGSDYTICSGSLENTLSLMFETSEGAFVVNINLEVN